MSNRGTAAKGVFLNMLLSNNIGYEHGFPSRPGDIILPPNVIIEIPDPKEKSYGFCQQSGKGETQWNVLKAKRERFPWLEIYYVIGFAGKE